MIQIQPLSWTEYDNARNAVPGKILHRSHQWVGQAGQFKCQIAWKDGAWDVIHSNIEIREDMDRMGLADMKAAVERSYEAMVREVLVAGEGFEPSTSGL